MTPKEWETAAADYLDRDDLLNPKYDRESAFGPREPRKKKPAVFNKIKDRVVVIPHGNSQYKDALEDPDYEGIDPAKDINFIDSSLSQLGEDQCGFAGQFAD